MQSTLTIHAVIWVVFAATVGSLALYRKFVSRGEVDMLHLGERETPIISQQVTFAHRLEAIDRWGKILTIALAAYGVLIVIGFGIAAWLQSLEQVH
jgi:hypothetical protein